MALSHKLFSELEVEKTVKQGQNTAGGQVQPVFKDDAHPNGFAHFPGLLVWV